MQRLLAGDVAMVVNFNARVSGAAKENKRNLVIAWDAGFWVGTDYWVQIANGPNPVGGREAAGVLLPPGNPGRPGRRLSATACRRWPPTT